MHTIPHRELRNNSSAVLARVAAGESIAVTNRGVVAAILSPPHVCELDRLEQAGQARPARVRDVDFTALPRVKGVSSREVLDELRGDR